MIYASLSERERYMGIHPALDRALSLLTEEYLKSIPTVRTEIDGDTLFAARFDVQTGTDEARLFEYHRRYLDLLTLAAGQERIDVATPEKLLVREHSGDYWGCAGEKEQSVILTPGSFLVLFPGDAHRPGMAVEGPEKVSRIVFKILAGNDG